MTVQDVAAHLEVSWDLVSIAKGHKYVTIVMDLPRCLREMEKRRTRLNPSGKGFMRSGPKSSLVIFMSSNFSKRN